jgi:hypothetical protein
MMVGREMGNRVEEFYSPYFVLAMITSFNVQSMGAHDWRLSFFSFRRVSRLSTGEFG